MMNSRISALMDGELETAEADLAAHGAARDPRLRAEWQEFQIVGDGLRNQGTLDFDISARVMAALADEATVLAPPPRRRQSPSPWLAMAAAVAGVAVVAWVGLGERLAPVGGGTWSYLSATRVAASAPPAVAVVPLPVGTEAMPTPTAESLARIQEYVVAHHTHAVGPAVGGGARHVRTVSVSHEVR